MNQRGHWEKPTQIPSPSPPPLSRQVDLTTRATRNLTLSVPILSSPMDTVTEGRMAHAMAALGGLGVLHYNCSIEAQVAEAGKVLAETRRSLYRILAEDAPADE